MQMETKCARGPMENKAQQRFGEVLAQFTLFKGMSISDLTQVMDRTKFDFRKYPAGKRIVKAGEVCHELLMVTHGTLRLVTTHGKGHFAVEETIDAPYIIQPENLYGLPRRYRSTVNSETAVNLISLNKREVNILLETIEVFRINLLNTLSTQSQVLLNEPWAASPQSLRDMLQAFFVRHCVQPQGEKTFHILMRQLAEMHGCKKLTVSKVLNAMKDEGLVRLSRGKIVIPEINALAETSNP